MPILFRGGSSGYSTGRESLPLFPGLLSLYGFPFFIMLYTWNRRRLATTTLQPSVSADPFESYPLHQGDGISVSCQRDGTWQASANPPCHSSSLTLLSMRVPWDGLPLCRYTLCHSVPSIPHKQIRKFQTLSWSPSVYLPGKYPVSIWCHRKLESFPYITVRCHIRCHSLQGLFQPRNCSCDQYGSSAYPFFLSRRLL